MSVPTLLVPLAVEAFAVRRGAPAAPIERIGMGPARARRLAARLSDAAPDRAMAVVGVGGGVVEGDRPGDVVVAERLADTAGAAPVELDTAHELATMLRAAGLRVVTGTIVSSPAIVRGAEPRARLAADGARAVDMESYWCAALADARPFAVVRVLVDVPGTRATRAAPALVAAYRSLRDAARVLASWRPEEFDRIVPMEGGED